MALCILAAGKVATLVATAFTLSWTHSVEKTRWEEDWKLTAAGLQIVEARVQGSGAGMEPPEGAVLMNGWWTWRPVVPAKPEIVLAASGTTGDGWEICGGAACLTVGAVAEEPAILRACREP